MNAIEHLVAAVETEKGVHYYNPRVSVSVPIPGGLQIGQRIHIHGSVAAEPSRFAINLQNGKGKKFDCYFHFNPRFDELAVVRNTRRGDDWGGEERDGGFPFAPATPFIVTIIPDGEWFQVEVNGSFFIGFKYRDELPLSNVSYIAVNGDVVVHGIHMPMHQMPKPLLFRIPKKATIGDTFCFKGFIPADADRFHINLQCGGDATDDVAFHFNPRFGEGAIVRNSLKDESWGEEERDGEMLLAPGQPFYIQMVATEDAFRTWINTVEFPAYNHRLNMRKVCTLVVDGDVVLEDVCVDCPPSLLPPQTGDRVRREMKDASLQLIKPFIPVVARISGGFGVGRVLILSGRIDNEPTRFRIDLQSDSSNDADIALHYNPRWDDGKVVVMNSRQDGSWGDEIRPDSFPFKEGKPFEVQITCLAEGFSVGVNGVQQIMFPHRLDFMRVDHVSVDGSLGVHRILVV